MGMELRKRLTKIFRPAEGKPLRPIPGDDNRPLKNGPLALAVAGSVMIMIVLGILDVKLIRHRSNKGVSVGPAIPAQPSPATFGAPVVGNKSGGDVPPEVTFYRQLTMQDDQSPANGKGKSDPNRETGASPSQPSTKAGEISKAPGKPENKIESNQERPWPNLRARRFGRMFCQRLVPEGRPTLFRSALSHSLP